MEIYIFNPSIFPLKQARISKFEKLLVRNYAYLNCFLLVYLTHSIAQDRMHQRRNMYVNNLVVRGDLVPMQYQPIFRQI